MAPARLLVHGSPLDHTLWDPQVQSLRDVARVVAPDLPGFGTSTAPRTTMTMDASADVSAGLSRGASVARPSLAKHAEKVRGLILCNPRAGADDEKAREGRRASEKK